MLLVEYASEPTLSRLQAVKAGIEILLTAVLVFVLLERSRSPLERSNRQLRRRQEKLHVLHRVLRHNLRNDLNVITAVARSLRDGTASDRAADCDRILRSADDILPTPTRRIGFDASLEEPRTRRTASPPTTCANESRPSSSGSSGSPSRPTSRFGSPRESRSA